MGKITTKELRAMSKEELEEWGDSAMYCGGLAYERYKIEKWRRSKLKTKTERSENV